MNKKIIWLENRQESEPNNKQIYYTPIVTSEIEFGPYKLLLQYRKTRNSVTVFVAINKKPMGYIFFNMKKDLFDLRESIIGLSYAPSSAIVGTAKSKKEWKERFEYQHHELWCHEIEKTITFHTLVSLIELEFPTNWLLLLE